MKSYKELKHFNLGSDEVNYLVPSQKILIYRAKFKP